MAGHYIRVLKMTDAVIVTQDLGIQAQAADYTAGNYPASIDPQNIAFEVKPLASALVGVVDLQTQVDVDGGGLTVTLNAPTTAELRAIDVDAAKAVLVGLDADPFNDTTDAKAYVQALRDLVIGKPPPA